MSSPSFLYTGVDLESQMLTEELERLGGGDARVARIEVHCVLDERRQCGGDQTLWDFEGAIRCRL
jgi:hypothetical protein